MATPNGNPTPGAPWVIVQPIRQRQLVAFHRVFLPAQEQVLERLKRDQDGTGPLQSGYVIADETIRMAIGAGLFPAISDEEQAGDLLPQQAMELHTAIIDAIEAATAPPEKKALSEQLTPP